MKIIHDMYWKIVETAQHLIFICRVNYYGGVAQIFFQLLMGGWTQLLDDVILHYVCNVALRITQEEVKRALPNPKMGCPLAWTI